MRRNLLAGVVAFAFAFEAQAQQFDGTWTGQAGQWNVTLAVSGTKARLTLSCGGTDGISDFTLGQGGSVNTYVTTGSGRRQITGTLPSIQIPPGGSCGGGTATMVKK